MTILLVGLSHHTAPVELREQFFLNDDGVRRALGELGAHFSESAAVSTCNRLELYGMIADEAVGLEMMTALLSRIHGLPADELRAHLYAKTGVDAVRHVMRVACGLDSLVMGEPQILGQVSQALALSQIAGAAGPILSHIFAGAVHAGKRARAETEISRHTVSISHAAAQLVSQQMAAVEEPRTLVVGAGEMAELAARGLQAHSLNTITIISRTPAHAAALAERLNVRAAPWDNLNAELSEADAVISATGAPHTVVHAADVAQAQLQRRRPLVIVDVAVPRDVDESVGALPGVTLFDIDDLNGVVDAHRARREAAAGDVEAIVAQEVENCLRWLNSREVVPTVVDLRRKAEALADAEIEQALRRLPDLSAREQAIVEQMARRIVNKLLHAPTTALKARAENGESGDYAQIVREIFELDATLTPGPYAASLRSPTAEQKDARPAPPSGRGEEDKAAKGRDGALLIDVIAAAKEVVDSMKQTSHG